MATRKLAAFWEDKESSLPVTSPISPGRTRPMALPLSDSAPRPISMGKPPMFPAQASGQPTVRQVIEVPLSPLSSFTSESRSPPSSLAGRSQLDVSLGQKRYYRTRVDELKAEIASLDLKLARLDQSLQSLEEKVNSFH